MTIKIRIFAIFASVLMLTVIAMPMVMAETIEILPILPPDKFTSIGVIVEENPLSIEIIENTRELAIVKIDDGKNGMLITQAIDGKYSTKDTTVTMLKIEDLNNGEVKEMEFVTSYKLGEYVTTIYDKGEILNTFSTQFDPLEPGILSELLNLNTAEPIKSAQNKIQNDLLFQSNYVCPLTGYLSFVWDGVPFVCGSHADMPYSRPNVELFRRVFGDPTLLCNERRWVILGNRINHFQLDNLNTEILVGLSLPLFIIISAIITLIVMKKTLNFENIWNLLTAITGAGIAGFLTGLALRDIFVDDRGTMWFFVHRTPLDPIYHTHVPLSLRIGRLNVWHVCSNINPMPCPDTLNLLPPMPRSDTLNLL